MRNKLINVFDGLSDSSTVDFIKENYEKLGDRGSDKLAMLNLLVDYKTTYSYSILKDLFVNKTPTNLGNRISVGYGVTDSLDLARILYPDILVLLKMVISGWMLLIILLPYLIVIPLSLP
ncbi:MAG: hypothetical protein IPN29_01840 [Saprospiraceae bacterium]|nr:hypothetical protein [Saprospiraceae bacterium]